MIITKLVGGLGNQMFQYALGRHLAHIHGTELKLDVRWYHKRIREYGLQHFNISGTDATEDEIRKIKHLTTRFSDRLRRNIIDRMVPFYLRSQVQEPIATRFDARVFKAPKNSYITGYWQSELYFNSISSLLRQEFAFNTPLEPTNKTVASNILATDSVSIHIRRGDYVNNELYQQVFGTCGVAYYQEGVQYINWQLPNAHFFVFSDDPDWTKEHIKLSQPATYIMHNTGSSSFRDLQLMSLCKHNIIANSTFSWWAAWLNANPAKMVIAPKNWYADTTKHNRDLIPATWIQI